MMLRDLQQYIATKRVVSLEELARQFTRDAEVISGMLLHWERKGTIRKLSPQSGNDCNAPCQQCRGCGQAQQVFYQMMQ